MNNNVSKTIEYEMAETENSTMAYIVIYQLITLWGLD